MAWDRQPPRAVETEHPATEHPATEHPAAEEPPAAVPAAGENDRPAHAWEFDEADSWEPVVPDTWDPPADADVAPTEEEWVDAAHGHAETGEPEWAPAGGTGQMSALDSMAPESLADFAPPAGPATDRDQADQPAAGPNPLRMALGLASMAAQRMRGGVPAGDGFVTGIGLVQETANGLRSLGRRFIDPAAQAAAVTVKGLTQLPFARAPVRMARRIGGGERLGAALAGARARGRQSLEAGRSEAEALLRRGLAETLQWAGTTVIPRLAERLGPRLADEVLPRLMADTEAGRAQQRPVPTGAPGSTGDTHEVGARTDGAPAR